MKKILALVLAMTMLLCMETVTAFASEGGKDDVSAVTYVAQIGEQKFETVLEAFAVAMESSDNVELKLLQDSIELLPCDFEFIVNADVDIIADTPVIATFYNDKTKYDLVFGSKNNNTITIGSNVTLKVNDRNIWLGYYGDKNATVKVYGTLSAGYQLWSGSDVEVYGTLESLGEALVLRRGKTLTVDGGKVNASYFSILSGNINAKNEATIKCGPVWISNTGNYVNEGNVEIVLDNATLISSSNLKSVTTHADGVSIAIKNNSTASFTGGEHGASQLDANTKLVVSGEDAQLSTKDLKNEGAIEVFNGGKVSSTGTITNNGTIEVENADDLSGNIEVNSNGTYIVTGDYIWTYDTDAGFYVTAGNAKFGLMRFLFGVDTEDTISEVGIKYIKGDDITSWLKDDANVTYEGNEKVFYGDVINIPESVIDGNYYAAAYIKVGKNYIWSKPQVCTPDWNKQFINYDGGEQ